MTAKKDQNPFGMVLTRIWEMLLRHPSIAADVRPQNRIRFDDETNRDPFKAQVQAGDLPELSVTVDTATVNLHNTSSSSMITRQYAVMVATGDSRYSELLSKIEWALFVATLGWRTQLTSLRWRDKAFVKRANLVNVTAGLSDPKLNRNIAGWSAKWVVEVEMHFETADLTQEMTDGST